MMRATTSKMTDRIVANTGSFRDPVNKVYELKPESQGGEVHILRGLSKDALAIFEREIFYLSPR